MSDGSWGSPAPPPPPPSGGAPRPAPTYPQPSRQPGGGNSTAFRDTLIVAALAVIGVAAMFVWSGGDAPEAATVVTAGTLPDDFGSIPGLLPPASGDVPSFEATIPDVTFGGSDSPDDPAASAQLVAALPAPSGGEEQPASLEGSRTWLVRNPDWQAVRDEWVGAITSAGYTINVSAPITDPGGAQIGESMTIFDQSSLASVFASLQALPDGTTSVAVLA